jgi:hypothetical protein
MHKHRRNALARSLHRGADFRSHPCEVALPSACPTCPAHESSHAKHEQHGENNEDDRPPCVIGGGLTVERGRTDHPEHHVNRQEGEQVSTARHTSYKHRRSESDASSASHSPVLPIRQTPSLSASYSRRASTEPPPPRLARSHRPRAPRAWTSQVMPLSSVSSPSRRRASSSRGPSRLTRRSVVVSNCRSFGSPLPGRFFLPYARMDVPISAPRRSRLSSWA